MSEAPSLRDRVHVDAPVRAEIVVKGSDDPSRVARLLTEHLRKVSPLGCEHVLVDDNFQDALTCAGCGLRISRMSLAALGFRRGLQRREPECCARANTLADDCQRLRDENTTLLAENARLRRDLERMKR